MAAVRPCSAAIQNLLLIRVKEKTLKKTSSIHMALRSGYKCWTLANQDAADRLIDAARFDVRHVT